MTSQVLAAYLNMMAISETPPPANPGKSVIDLLARLVPRRFRKDIPVVPVVRLSGVIGVVTPLRPGLLEPSTDDDFSYLVMPIRLNV